MASLEGDCLVVFYYLNTFEIWPDKRDGLIRGMAFGGSDLIRGMTFDGSGIIRGMGL
jgi:hypothetical protein